MSHSRNRLDISTRGEGPSFRSLRNIALWLLIFVLALAIFYLNPDAGWTIMLPLLGFALLVFILMVAWFVIIKRGVFTWMRLAARPARLMAAHDPTGAEAAFAQGLARARQFGPDDHRRGLMLCELAMFAKNQARVKESLDLYEESCAILAKHLPSAPLDYFVVLNNYAICFIHLKDYANAQRLLEKAIDLTLTVRKRQVAIALSYVQMVQFVLHLNLAFLFMEMRALGEAEQQLQDADALLLLLSKAALTQWHDHYVAICALWEFESGKFADAEKELAQARNPEYPACLTIRARLLLVRQDFAQAEELLRKYQDTERKKGTLHRPELLKVTLDLSESLFGQDKHDDAFAAFQEARGIVADFALPFDAFWRRMLETWLPRIRALGKTDLGAVMEQELRSAPVPATHAITILDKLHLHEND